MSEVFWNLERWPMNTEPCSIELTAKQAEALYTWFEYEHRGDYWETPMAPVQQQVSAWRRANG